MVVRNVSSPAMVLIWVRRGKADGRLIGALSIEAQPRSVEAASVSAATARERGEFHIGEVTVRERQMKEAKSAREAGPP